MSTKFSAFLKKILPLVVAFFLFTVAFTQAQHELPAPPAQLESIKTGSLIIPMDTLLQAQPGYFNLKSYGLINKLLQSEIPVKWAIKAGKTKTGGGATDFAANSNRVFPDTTANAFTTYRSGPFIIDSAWVSKALPVIGAYGNNVRVYKLNTTTNIDIRYTLSFKPQIALLNSTGYDTIAVRILQEAGFSSSSYNLMLPAGQVFNQSSVYSLASDTHYSGGDTTHVNPVKRFVTDYGGNLIASCAAQGAFENKGLLMTSLGIDSAGSASITGITYSNHDLPISQFHGNLIVPIGEYKYWFLKTGSTFKSTSYNVMHGNATPGSTHPVAGTNLKVVTGAKLKPVAEKGGNVYYLSGHEFFFNTSIPYSPNDNNKINGRRIFLNSIFIPPGDSIGYRGLDFRTDVQLSMVACSTLAVKNEPFALYIIAKNLGPGRAKTISVQAPLPASLSYLSSVATKGIYDSGTGIWTIDSLSKNETDTLTLIVTINQIGNITYNALANNESLEFVTLNNNSSISFVAVSRPVAVNDTVIFAGGYTVEKNTKVNDTDEDGDTFGNTVIASGPFNGSAIVLDADSIRYSPVASFTGMDSLLYVTCDNYPLCDSGWLFINVVSPLPVELVYFKGKRSAEKINLSWQTLSEKDNDYFEVQRSYDGQHFESRGKVKGNGTTNIPREYQFTDTDNGKTLLYYRLRQFDFNGMFHLSPVIALRRNGDNNTSSLTIYPNPVDGDETFIVRMDGLNQGTSEMRITDLIGRVIFSKTIELEEEITHYELVPSNLISYAGCYLLTLTNKNETVTTRLVVK